MDTFVVLPFVEIEIRLGTITKNHFDSSVDKKYFEKIKQSLETGEWKTIVNKNTIEYLKSVDSGNLKLITENDSKSLLLLKEKVKNEDFSVSISPFDIRLSINQEFKLNSQINSFSKNDCLVRSKTRKSFISDDFCYDLTIVNENKEGVIKTKYEIEIELLINKNTIQWTSNYINDFLECKVYDLINVVEPIDRDKFKLKLK
jgi:hypothetical protein